VSELPEELRQLCALASKEMDSEKLFALVAEINRLFSPDLTTKGTKEHEGTPLGFNPLCNFVSFVVHELDTTQFFTKS
jgi:hypothetical protein